MALSRLILGDPTSENNIVWKMEKGKRHIDIDDLWAIAHATTGTQMLHATSPQEIVGYLATVSDELSMSPNPAPMAAGASSESVTGMRYSHASRPDLGFSRPRRASNDTNGPSKRVKAA